MRYAYGYISMKVSPKSQKLLNRFETALPFILLLLLLLWLLIRPYEIVEDEPSQSMSARRILLEPMDSICRREPDLLIFVHTRTEAIDRRNEWRKNYGKLAAKNNFSIIFSLGLSDDELVNATINKESEIYGDILQGDFMDTYRNITHKHLQNLRYASTLPCSKVPVVFKVDDDLVLNVRNLLKIVENVKNEDETSVKTGETPKIWCNVLQNATIERMSNDKWAIPRSRLPETMYPDYCSGMGIFYPRSAIPKLLEAVEQERWFWVDDALVTGYLRVKAEISLMDISEEFEKRDGGIRFSYGVTAFKYAIDRADTDRLYHLVNDLN